MTEPGRSASPGPSLGRRLARGALHFCPTCWAIGLVEKISAGRLERRCTAGGCGRSRASTMLVLLLALAVFGGVTASQILAAGNAITVRAGDLVLHADLRMSPQQLPEHEFAPITVHVGGSVQTADGSHVPPVQTVSLQADRHLRVDSTGLPSCTKAKITATSPEAAMAACGGALVGKGFVTAQVQFPEQAPLDTKGPLLIFNGPAGAAGPAYPEMFFYTYLDVPVPTAVVVVAKLSPERGRYGFKITATVPRIAGGAGSLTGFELTAGRSWTYRGTRHSYLDAECEGGHFLNRFEADYGDGTDLTGALVNSCQSKS